MKNTNEIKTPMELFGYDCGDGWFPLIKEAKQLIDEWNEQHSGVEPLKFVQIKEKWGGLCLYLNYYPDDLYDKIHDLEKQSLYICEDCGSDKHVSTEWTHNWLMTLCPDCRNKEIHKFENHAK